MSASKRAYLELLKRPEWIEKAKEIRRRDSYTCRRCRRRGLPMDVHHTTHFQDRMPWEQPDWAMITVCRECHDFLHGYTTSDPANPPRPPGTPVSREDGVAYFKRMRDLIG